MLWISSFINANRKDNIIICSRLIDNNVVAIADSDVRMLQNGHWRWPYQMHIAHCTLQEIYSKLNQREISLFANYPLQHYHIIIATCTLSFGLAHKILVCKLSFSPKRTFINDATIYAAMWAVKPFACIPLKWQLFLNKTKFIYKCMLHVRCTLCVCMFPTRFLHFYSIFICCSCFCTNPNVLYWQMFQQLSATETGKFLNCMLLLYVWKIYKRETSINCRSRDSTESWKCCRLKYAFFRTLITHNHMQFAYTIANDVGCAENCRTSPTNLFVITWISDGFGPLWLRCMHTM